MSGVFLSYSRVDRALADQVTKALRAVGVDCWWDEDMGGVDWQEELEKKISNLAAVVVLWSEASSASKSVRDEARLALSADKLVNAMIGLKQPPFPFDRVNGLPLNGWQPGEPHRGWERLVQTVEDMVVRVGDAKPGDFTSALARQEQALLLKRSEIAQLSEAVHEAQAREEDAREDARLAQESLDREQEQFQRFVDLRPGARVLAAAQAELDVVRETAFQAEQTLQSKAAALREAERQLASAERSLSAPVAPTPPPTVVRAAAPTPAPTPKEKPLAKPVVKPAAPPKPPAAVKPPAAIKPAPAPEMVKPKSAPVLETRPPAIAPVAVAAVFDAPADEPGPAFLPQPTRPPVAANAWITPPRIGLAAVAVAVLIGGALAARGLTHSGQSVAAAVPAASDAATATNPAAAQTAAQPSAAVLTGNWAMQGLSCDQPVTIAVKADMLSMVVAGQTYSATLQGGGDTNVIKAQASDGAWRYQLDHHDKLKVAGPGGLALKMTRCAG